MDASTPIPTRLIAEPYYITEGKRRAKVWPTDVGDLTTKEASERTGMSIWKIRNRFNLYGATEGLFLDERLKTKVKKVIREEADDELMKLLDKPRDWKVGQIKLGTWEMRQ